MNEEGGWEARKRCAYPNDQPIDIVIPWVDGSDPDWLAAKRVIEPGILLPDSGEHNFRDWGLLRYLFRGIEKFMPWVRTVHFVTWGHLPAWLDEECEKLHIVRHEDFIPKEYLPTFSSHTIELNFHRIEGLAEEFIYFNDDMYVIREAQPEDFFIQGIPRDLAALNVHCYARSRPIDLIQVCDVGIINEHFDFKHSIRANMRKWLRPGVGKALMRTLPLLGCPRFPGFYQTHCPQPLLKSTYEAVWSVEPDVLDATCRHQLRESTDVNQWVMREWQIASGNFLPRPARYSEVFYLDKNNPTNGLRKIVDVIDKGSRTLICVNDSAMETQDLTMCQEAIKSAFQKLLPQRSCFELGLDQSAKAANSYMAE